MSICTGFALAIDGALPALEEAFTVLFLALWLLAVAALEFDFLEGGLEGLVVLAVVAFAVGAALLVRLVAFAVVFFAFGFETFAGDVFRLMHLESHFVLRGKCTCIYLVFIFKLRFKGNEVLFYLVLCGQILQGFWLIFVSFFGFFGLDFVFGQNGGECLKGDIFLNWEIGGSLVGVIEKIRALLNKGELFWILFVEVV